MRGVHRLAPGPGIVEGRCVREFMFMLDGISVGEQSTRERDRVPPCNGCDQPFKSLPTLNQHKIWQHIGYVFLARSSIPTTALTDTRSLCVASFTTVRAFANFLCTTITTIKKIILNLNVRGGEGDEEAVLAISRKRADILYHLNYVSIMFILNKTM